MPDYTALVERLMFLLGERSLSQQAVIPCHMARDLLRGGPITVHGFPEFRLVLVQAMQVFLGSVYGGISVPENIAENQLKEILGRMRTSIEDLYPEAANGYQGGLNHIYDKITEQMIRNLSESWYARVLETEVNPVDYEFVYELLNQFMARYSGILPAELKRMPTAGLMANWKETLVACAGLIAQFERQLTVP